MFYKCSKCKTSARDRGGIPKCPKCGQPMQVASAATATPAPTLSGGVHKPKPKKASAKARGRLLLKTAPKTFGLLKRRSGSAPVVIGKKLKVTAKFTHLISDVINHPDWFNAGKRGIRLTYEQLNPDPNAVAFTQAQGLWIKHPSILSSTDAELHNHFEQLAVEMLQNHKPTDATEATGEAAAALAVATTAKFAGFKMKWGKHMHSGPGIDQIYYNPTPPAGDRPDGTYLIVEAKGVGACLTFDFHRAPHMQMQMSNGWIYHNLATMARNNHQIAIDLMKHVGLTEQYKPGTNPAHEIPFEPNYGGSSKNYYNCRHDPTAQTARLCKMVVTATWNQGCELGFKISDAADVHL